MCDDPDMTASAAPLWIRIPRFAFAALGILALVWIPIRNLDDSAFSVANYFSYFTIQSNVLAVIVLLVGAGRDRRDRRWQALRGATTLYLLITGVVYAVLLAKVGVMLTDEWINDVLHRIRPRGHVEQTTAQTTAEVPVQMEAADLAVAG